MAKEGSTVSGLMDSFATAVSLALQHGVPLRLLCDKFQHTRFEPAGFTGNQEIPIAKSVMDYIFRWLEIRFVSGQQFPLFPSLNAGAPSAGALGLQSGSQAVTPATQQSAFSQSGGPQLVGGAQAASAASENRGTQTYDARVAQPASSPMNQAASDPLQPVQITETTPPQGGLPRSQELAASSFESPRMEDRGIYHPSNAMKDLVDMGDAPSCHVCGAIMTRNGSCYRCMSCGSTSGCS
jgi:ribonucleoside-diphosphate reductase alpha chain